MGYGNLAARVGGVLSSLMGASFISVSLKVLPSPVSLGSNGYEMLGRAGFAFLLMGLFTLFLFSFRSVPEDLAISMVRTSDTNTGRLLEALNLEGTGVHIPPGGRLIEDRVYVPMEKLHLKVPAITDATVFNVGTTEPSMGVSLVPPGRDLMELVEARTGKRFSEDGPTLAQEALDRLAKGTGLYKRIEVRGRGDALDLTISHSRMKGACLKAWKEHPRLHSMVGCVGCSAVLCALARIYRRPLRIVSARETNDGTHYELGRE